VAASLEQASTSSQHEEAYDARNPYPAPVIKSRNLFAIDTDRSCMHMEFDITNTGITYEAGDHLGVWPCNTDLEVERMLAILGLSGRRQTAVSVVPLDASIASPPVPSTYEAIFRYYLDITSVASRQTIAALAKFAPTGAAHEKLTMWGSNRDHYEAEIIRSGYKIGEVLQLATSGISSAPKNDSIWSVPFDRIISELPRVQPRFYSISSSSKLHPDSVHIAAVVLRYKAFVRSFSRDISMGCPPTS
jgi:NADPH-ferrihemoprotein reductase